MAAQTLSLLRSLREAQRLSQRELARRSGVIVDTISRLERGQAPSLEDARLLARALGVTVDFLWPEAEREAS